MMAVRGCFRWEVAEFGCSSLAGWVLLRRLPDRRRLQRNLKKKKKQVCAGCFFLINFWSLSFHFQFRFSHSQILILVCGRAIVFLIRADHRAGRSSHSACSVNSRQIRTCARPRKCHRQNRVCNSELAPCRSAPSPPSPHHLPTTTTTSYGFVTLS